jgi:hypothetical protein
VCMIFVIATLCVVNYCLACNMPFFEKIFIVGNSLIFFYVLNLILDFGSVHLLASLHYFLFPFGLALIYHKNTLNFPCNITQL